MQMFGMSLGTPLGANHKAEMMWATGVREVREEISKLEETIFILRWKIGPHKQSVGCPSHIYQVPLSNAKKVGRRIDK